MKPALVIFDLDGTLTASKQLLTEGTAEILSRLLSRVPVAIASGGALPQFLKQVVGRLPADAHLANLYLMPTSGAALYEFRDGDWRRIYEETLSEAQAREIERAMREAAQETGIIDFAHPAWGDRIENRGGQVTLSALGQQAPLSEKKAWDPTHDKRTKLREAIAARLPHYLVAFGGSTSIDVTKKGVDKAYGIHKLCQRLGTAESDALYVGDELRAGGNDEAVFKTKVQTKCVASVAETEQFIGSLLA